MNTKDKKIVQIFFNCLCDKYDNGLRIDHINEQEKMQDLITDWIDNGRKSTDSDYDELKKCFLDNTKRLYNKGIREKIFSDLWLNYSPKEL